MNVLAIVEGIVRLTRAEDTPHYAAAVQRRVRALAQAHIILAERGWRDVPLAKLVEVQIEPFNTERVSREGPEVLLNGDTVQPLALVLHELIANAVSHGALSRPAGALTIRWRPSADRSALTLEWAELGGPTPSKDRAEGFGATIIKGIVDRQLRGRVQRRWESDGLKLQLDFPLSPDSPLS